jgi:four helix bundle protein
MAIKSFRDLDAWQVGMDLMLRVYDAVKRLPPHERFEMASQMRRAAVSIPSNVAEGHACRMLRRYRNHVRIALGSVAELATNVEAGVRLGYWDRKTANELDGEFTRMNKLLNGVLRSIWRQLLAEAAGCVAWILLLSEIL